VARYEHLPIYKQAMDVAVHFEQVVAGFSRYHKYTLGTDLRNKSREVVALIESSGHPSRREFWTPITVRRLLAHRCRSPRWLRHREVRSPGGGARSRSDAALQVSPCSARPPEVRPTPR